MIKIVPLNGTPAGYYESFDEFFRDVTTTENSKLVDDQTDLSQMNWSFTVYPPKRDTVYIFKSFFIKSY